MSYDISTVSGINVMTQNMPKQLCGNDSAALSTMNSGKTVPWLEKNHGHHWQLSSNLKPNIIGGFGQFQNNCSKYSPFPDSSTVFRALDLICLLASPILSGFLMTFTSPLIAVLALAAYCLVAWIPELTLLRWACSTSNRLR